MVGLGNVDNTADANKAVLSATKLATARTIQGKSFDGTANITLDNATTSAAGLMSAADKSKLNGIAANANNYTHPASHPASMITDLPTGKKVARFVVGTSTAGWTSSDCDYLCDGTEDQVEINNAITALPATGGEVVILDGTYNITAKIDITKDNVSIRGNGNATILKRMFNVTSAEGVITLTNRSGCKIANLQIDGNKTSYTNNNNHGIYLSSSSNNTVTGNTCDNNKGYGIYLYNSSNNNTVTGNTCDNNNNHGIYLYNSSNNTLTSNTCDNNSSGIYLNSSSNNNTVTGNTCDNNTYGIRLASSSNNNTVTGNTCIRGTGLTTDYTVSQHTIWLYGTDNSYNLISNNNCMGKAVTNEGGTGNTLVNNKFNAT
jgi:parallel beta-helix repeat protein